LSEAQKDNILRQFRSWLFPDFRYRFIIHRMLPNFSDRLAEEGLECLQQKCENSEALINFEIPNSRFIQAWLWGPIVGQVVIKDGDGYFTVNFVGFDIISKVTVCLGLGMAVIFLFSHLLAGLGCVLFAFVYPRAAFYVSVLFPLGPRIKKLFGSLNTNPLP